jgi:hypothetical protein
MRHAVVFDRVFKRFRYVLLADQIVERLRAPLAGYDLVAHLLVFSLSFLAKQKSSIILELLTSDIRSKNKNRQLETFR